MLNQRGGTMQTSSYHVENHSDNKTNNHSVSKNNRGAGWKRRNLLLSFCVLILVTGCNGSTAGKSGASDSSQAGNQSAAVENTATLAQTVEVIATKAPTKTSAPTQKPTATETQIPVCDSFVTSEAPAFTQKECEDFSTQGSWSIDKEDSDKFHIDPDVKDGQYIVAASTDPAMKNYVGGYYGWANYPYSSNFSSTDFYASVVIGIKESDYWTASGLGFGDEKCTYHFMVDTFNNNYVLRRYDQTAQKWRELINWKFSDAIKKDVNHVSLMTHEGTVSLFINGEKVRDVKLKDTISNGWIGLAYYVPFGKSGVFTFDNLLIMLP
jgi:hypothetical protein